MLFGADPDALLILLEFKERNDAVLHELGGYRAANQQGEFGGTNCEVLFNLHDIQLVSSALCLNRKHIVSALLVHAYVDFIGLDCPISGVVVRR